MTSSITVCGKNHQGRMMLLFLVICGVSSFVQPVVQMQHQRRCVLFGAFKSYEGSDPWAELGVAEGADATELRRAYRKAAMKTHPDVNKAPEAKVEFERVQSAYELLRDKEKLAVWQRKRAFSRAKDAFTGGSRSSSSSSSTPPPHRSGRTASSTGSWRPPPPAEYDDAGGDSFGAILGDLFRGFASAPKSSARAVFDDLLDVLEKIPSVDAGGPREFQSESERDVAAGDQKDLVQKLETMLKLRIVPDLAKAKADEAVARSRNDIDALLEAVEHSAGLQAKKEACERQLKIAKRELDAINRARVDGSRTTRKKRADSPSSSSYSSSSYSSSSSSSSSYSPPPSSTKSQGTPYRSSSGRTARRQGGETARTTSSSSPPPYSSSSSSREEQQRKANDDRVNREFDELKRSGGGPRQQSSPRGRSSPDPFGNRVPLSERVDQELDELKRAMGRGGRPGDNSKR